MQRAPPNPFLCQNVNKAEEYTKLTVEIRPGKRYEFNIQANFITNQLKQKNFLGGKQRNRCLIFSIKYQNKDRDHRKYRQILKVLTELLLET